MTTSMALLTHRGLRIVRIFRFNKKHRRDWLRAGSVVILSETIVEVSILEQFWPSTKLVKLIRSHKKVCLVIRIN